MGVSPLIDSKEEDWLMEVVDSPIVVSEEDLNIFGEIWYEIGKNLREMDL